METPLNTTPDLQIVAYHGDEAPDAVYELRHEVFVLEQDLVHDAGHDFEDSRSVHIVAWVGDEPVGTGRVTYYRSEAQVAWVAVRESWRKHGIGGAVMRAIIDEATRHGATHIMLNAQTHALNFYGELGFRPLGSEFKMAGIGHMVMTLDLV